MLPCSIGVPTSFNGIFGFYSVPKLQIFDIVFCMVYCSDFEQYSSVCYKTKLSFFSTLRIFCVREAISLLVLLYVTILH